MKDLKCGLKTCKFNKGYCCNAKQISVSDQTECSSYTYDQQNASLFEAGSDFVKVNYSVDTQVGCKAACLFNKNDTCIANGITVMNDEKHKAGCLTFLKN
jgi:hypothetical protein